MVTDVKTPAECRYSCRSFLVKQKGTRIPKMHTRAKRKVVAGDRARRQNVPWHMPPGVRVRENVVANTDKKKYTKHS